MNYDQLNPAKSFIILEGDVYELSPFSLRKMVDLGTLINPENPEKGLEVLNDAMNQDQLYDLVYYFLEDKDTYPTYCNFKKAVDEDKDCTDENLRIALQETINNSQPIFTEKEITKIKEEVEQSDVEEIADSARNWVHMYTLYAMAIPITIEQFYNMTMRQIHAILKEIIAEKQKNLTLQASFYGKRIVTQAKTPKPAFDKKTDEQLLKLAEENLKKWQSKANKS